MGTGTIWVSFRVYGNRHQMGITYYYGPTISVSGLLVDETPTPFFCRCEVRNLNLRIRVIDPELLGDLTFWFLGGCDPHPVFLDICFIYSPLDNRSPWDPHIFTVEHL